MAGHSALLVASGGGHLAQLHALAGRLTELPSRRVWVTFDTPQSRSLLAGEETVEYVPYLAPRDVVTAMRLAPAARRILHSHSVDTVVSTGSGVALPFMFAARTRRSSTHYIESAARSNGPSLTGRILSRLPGMRCYSQYPSWAGDRWRFVGSVFDEFQPVPARERRPVARVVVTLGTIAPYGFRRLLQRLVHVLPDGAEVLWQTGATDVSGLGIDARPTLPGAELGRAIADADVVIAHAGIGSALGALRAGKCPILVPRKAAHGEHVDDHQEQIAGELSRRDLAVHVEADEIAVEHLVDAAGRAARQTQAPPLAIELRR